MNSVLSMQSTMLIDHYHYHLLSYIMILMQRVNPCIQPDYFILQDLSQTERALRRPIWHLEIPFPCIPIGSLKTCVMLCIGTFIFPDNTPGEPTVILRVCPLIAKASCPIPKIVIATISK